MDIEKIYKLYFEDIYKFLLSLTKNKEIAQDITSETFLKVINNMEKVNQATNIKSYLFTIAKNTYITYYNRNKIFIVTEDIEKFDRGMASFEDDLILESELAKFNKAINKLDEPQRSIVKLRLGEMDFDSIGRIYGKTANWACVNFYRAKDKLRKYMEDDYEL